MNMPSKLGLGLLSLLVGTMLACSSDEDPGGDGSSSSGGGSSSSSGGENGASSSSGGTSSSSGGTSSSSSGGSSGTSSSSGGNEESLQATVTAVELTQDDDCELALTVPKVDTPSDAADAKILAAIPITAPDYCEAGEEMSYDGSYEVPVNEWGVLSIALSHSSYYAGAAHPSNFVIGHNFDIATGDSIELDALLDADGIAKLRAACVAKLTDPEVGYEPDMAGEQCAMSIDGFEGEGGGNIQIEKTGLRLYLSLSHAEFPIALEGAFVTWTDLGSTVISPLVQKLVSKQ